MTRITRATAGDKNKKSEELWYLIHFTETNEYGTHLKKLCKQKTLQTKKQMLMKLKLIVEMDIFHLKS
jgi:hypothetical protein